MLSYYAFDFMNSLSYVFVDRVLKLYMLFIRFLFLFSLFIIICYLE